MLIEAREIENLAPWEVVQRALRQNPKVKHSSVFQAIYSDTGTDLWLYVDLKEGLSREKFEALPAETKALYENHLSRCGVDPEECGCPVFSGLGDRNIRTAFAEFAAEVRKSPCSIAAFRPDQRRLLEGVTLEALSWFCGGKRFVS
jgi:hypothetical protein